MAMDWFAQLRPASFRGVPFGVTDSGATFGRRVVLHDYPYRDTVWMEDLGRAARRISISGFLVGDDAQQQREKLIAACETPGNGELVHPTLGSLTVSLETFESRERRDHGRVFELALSFIEAGSRVFPATDASTADDLDRLAQWADDATGTDYATRATAALRTGSAVAKDAAAVAAEFGAVAMQQVRTATNLYHMVTALPGSFGRYTGGNHAGRNTASATYGALVGTLQSAGDISASLNGLIAQGAAARVTVTRSAAALTDAALRLGL